MKLRAQGQFHQHFTGSLYKCRSQKRKKKLWFDWIFMLLGFSCVKAAHKHVDEIDTWMSWSKSWSTNLKIRPRWCRSRPLPTIAEVQQPHWKLKLRYCQLCILSKFKHNFILYFQEWPDLFWSLDNFDHYFLSRVKLLKITYFKATIFAKQ